MKISEEQKQREIKEILDKANNTMINWFFIQLAYESGYERGWNEALHWAVEELETVNQSIATFDEQKQEILKGLK